MKILYTILFLIVSITPLKAEADLSQSLTLSELIDIALQNNPETRIAWWNAQQAAAAVGSAQGAYYPKLGIAASANNGRTYKFVNGPDVNYTTAGVDLTLSYLLYDCGERSAKVNAAQMALCAAQWQSNLSFQKVMVKVLENGYSYLNAQAILEADISSLNDAQKMLEAAQELNRVGLTSVSDLYTSKATLAQMQMEVAQQKASVDIWRAKLATSLGLNIDYSIQVAPLSDPIYTTQIKQDVNQLIALAQQQRADLMAKQARIAESYARLDQAKATYGPKVRLSSRGGVDYGFHDHSNGAQYQFGLNIDIPLFVGFDSVYQNRMAYAATQSNEEELAQLELDIALEVLTQSRTVEASQEMLTFANDNLQNALMAYEGVLEKYRAGKERIAEVSNAQRQLAQARIRYSDVKTRWYVALAQLAYATGTLSNPLEVPCPTSH